MDEQRPRIVPAQAFWRRGAEAKERRFSTTAYE